MMFTRNYSKEFYQWKYLKYWHKYLELVGGSKITRIVNLLHHRRINIPLRENPVTIDVVLKAQKLLELLELLRMDNRGIEEKVLTKLIDAAETLEEGQIEVDDTLMYLLRHLSLEVNKPLKGSQDDDTGEVFKQAEDVSNLVSTPEIDKWIDAQQIIRKGQSIFRTNLLGEDPECAVSGINRVDLLQAAHIKPYSEDGSGSIDNGFLLIHNIHRAFDYEYISFDEQGYLWYRPTVITFKELIQIGVPNDFKNITLVDKYKNFSFQHSKWMAKYSEENPQKVSGGATGGATGGVTGGATGGVTEGASVAKRVRLTPRVQPRKYDTFLKNQGGISGNADSPLSSSDDSRGDYSHGDYSRGDYRKSRKSRNPTIQQNFRKNILNQFKGCVVSEIELLGVIDAAHIKDYAKESQDQHETNVNNGLILLASLHAAFDHNFISFDQGGYLWFCPEKISGIELITLGVPDNFEKIATPSLARKRFLEERFKEYIQTKHMTVQKFSDRATNMQVNT